MARLDAYFLRQTGGFLSKGDGLMGDFYLASVGEFSRAPKQILIIDGACLDDRHLFTKRKTRPEFLCLSRRRSG